MKKIFFFFAAIVLFAACKPQPQAQPEIQTDEIEEVVVETADSVTTNVEEATLEETPEGQAE